MNAKRKSAAKITISLMHQYIILEKRRTDKMEVPYCRKIAARILRRAVVTDIHFFWRGIIGGGMFKIHDHGKDQSQT